MKYLGNEGDQTGCVGDVGEHIGERNIQITYKYKNTYVKTLFYTIDLHS